MSQSHITGEKSNAVPGTLTDCIMSESREVITVVYFMLFRSNLVYLINFWTLH